MDVPCFWRVGRDAHLNVSEEVEVLGVRLEVVAHLLVRSVGPAALLEREVWVGHDILGDVYSGTDRSTLLHPRERRVAKSADIIVHQRFPSIRGVSQCPPLHEPRPR